MKLETERLVIRNWQESDANHYYVLGNDVGYNCFSRPGYYLARNMEEAGAKVRERMLLFEDTKLGKFPIFLRAAGELIGTCGLGPFEMDGQPEVELGYRLCLKFWGQGYASEGAAAMLRYGFRELQVARIMAFAVPQNKASLRVLEKLGFAYLRDFLHAEIPHCLYELPRSRFSG